MNEFRNLHIENDKLAAPFLLAASFNNLIRFQGSHCENGVLYWQFSPQDKAKSLINQFRTKTEPHIPARDLFEAIETWWGQVAEIRNGGLKDEENYS